VLNNVKDQVKDPTMRSPHRRPWRVTMPTKLLANVGFCRACYDKYEYNMGTYAYVIVYYYEYDSDYDVLNFIIGNVYAYNRWLVVSTFVLFPKNGMLAKLTYILFVGQIVETTNRCINNIYSKKSLGEFSQPFITNHWESR